MTSIVTQNDPEIYLFFFIDRKIKNMLTYRYERNVVYIP
jgi:hypothetical protein